MRPLAKYLRIPAACASASIVLILVYAIWSPGFDPKQVPLNRHTNGIWMSHGWIGDDQWFKRNQREPNRYHSPESLSRLKTLITDLDIVYLYPHLSPALTDGSLPGYNRQQIEKIASITNVMVMPWVGGVNGTHVLLDQESWRRSFTQSIADLLSGNPELAGIHVNIEPLRSGSYKYVILLSEIRQAIGPEKILSIAAYPPPTFWQQVDEVHWSREFYSEVSEHADQLVLMMYDTAIDYKKIYINTYKSWVSEVLAWSNSKDVLFGIPAYEDLDVDYHNPAVENIRTAMSGLSAGIKLNESKSNYRGISIYADWTLQDHEKTYIIEALGMKKSN
jgi:hypothetical protein